MNNMAKKSFNEKLLDSKDMPKIVEVTDPKAILRYGGTRMLIAPPLAYDEIMKKVPYGKVITSDYIRSYLAKKHGADYTCQLTAGIFINIAAHASEERKTDETPYWRMLKKDGELNEKYPGGIDGQKLRLEMEGHTIIQKGKRYFVKDYEEKLFEIND
ncbi:MAG TPA: methylated DNA-protein cysteine methyltransferase [Clostridiaceae bacterium]|nr:methylated DNA-protein cysteine methyltransferase [Clostridiaceae bacterium]